MTVTATARVIIEKDDVDFINGVERNAEHPATFPIPDEADRKAVMVGDHVKIGVEKIGGNGERFWVKVIRRDGDEIEGEVDNHLVFTDQHGIEFGDRLTFGPEHVLGL